ncbi:hypothetical protein DFQ01_102386 [Paenibacillus cellulosilyticus]|uniref:Uncharacterized protein n=1 Tax=Paenibacillus cellulosilyticus TaxID=375489 RepID=A0A2V2YZD6_9BACL|nr:hypothetical protein [Paenibacillus cellulosilyticus]PWW07489.1 hypothetical protein DFQ01_102386 [Paenibacillus cellulosilyticus]QKS44357.1 hypothetical protein HUB94_07965 [Paenibacillus cellulosilyticus]
MERAWTEKEPLVPEWYDHKEDKKEQADGMPKLSMKLLYGMIQELKQSSEQLSARLDDFEHYMIEVQAARAQLEADAARTIARAKALAAYHERVAFAEAAAAVPGMAAAPPTSAVPSSDFEDEETTVMELAEAVVEHPTAAAEEKVVEHPTAAAEEKVVVTANMTAVTANVPHAEVEVESVGSMIEPEPSAALSAEEHAALLNTVTEIFNHSSTAVEPIADNNSQAAEERIVIEAIPLHAKPGKLESQPSYLMSLAQEVLGFTSSDEDVEDGLDPGEGANPFDPDSFAAHSMEIAEAQAAPAAALPAQHSAAAMSSPFFTPRSQRHQSSKKTFLSLFGFRTRIS